MARGCGKVDLVPRRSKETVDDFEDDLELDDDVGDDEEPEFRGPVPLDGEDAASKPKTLTRKEAIDILQTTRNFSGLDFRKANLAKLDFSGCDFSASNLSYTNFKDSNLETCNFSNASLWNANLEGANLTRANLEDADLDYTKLRGACLFRANVRRATLPTDLIPRDEILRSIQDGTKINR